MGMATWDEDNSHDIVRDATKTSNYIRNEIIITRKLNNCKEIGLGLLLDKLVQHR